MTTFVMRNGKLVEKHLAGPKESLGTGKLRGIISDEMPETRHMADGQYYTSKAKFRQATKAAGCVEIGSETKYLLQPRKPIVLDREKRREDIQRAIYQIKNQRAS